MSDWMRRGELMGCEMTMTIITYKGLTSGGLLQAPIISTDFVHKNCVFVRRLVMSESMVMKIRRRLIAHGMDPESPIFDDSESSGPAIELAVRVEDDFKIDDLEIYNDPFIEINKSIKVDVKSKISGVVSGSLNGIRAQFGRDNGQG